MAADMITDRFTAFVRLGRNGAGTWPRIAGTVVLLVALSALATLATIAAIVIVWPEESEPPGGVSRLIDTPPGLALTLLSIAVLWPGLWLGLRWFHRRPLATVLGYDGRLPGLDLADGLLVGFAVPVLLGLLTLPFGPVPVRSGVGLGTWLLMLLPIAGLVLLQASAEEAVFRGYLPQVLAARGHGAAVWFLAPALLFSALHWYSDIPAWKNLSVVATIAVFAAGQMFVVMRTGRIAAACGLHWGNNIVALQIVSLDDGLGAAALYHLPPLSDPAWDATAIAAAVAVSFPMTALQVGLLLHPRSPLRIGR